MMKPYLTLTRAGLSFFAASSAAAGYILSSRRVSFEMMISAFGVFLLACGASALNQVQERDIDAKMERTRLRPVASGAMTARKALITASFFIMPGLYLIGLEGVMPLLLGIFALLWYNGFYTYLKRRSAFAAVPGALVGAIPPAIGWTAAGGTVLDASLFALCSLLFLWQVPHFWLLALRYGGEYRAAGLPTPLEALTPRQVGRLTFTWIAATAAATLALPAFFGSGGTAVLYLCLIPPALWLALSGTALVRKPPADLPLAALFGKVNGYLLAVLAIIAAFSLLERS